MESCLLDLAKNEVQSLVNLVKNEAQYLCCFNSYVENFEQKKNILAAKHKDVKRKFQKGKGVFSFKFEAQQWEHEADDIILIDTKIKKKLFFGGCLDCWWKYQRGKELAEKTQQIEKLLERCNSNIVAGRANALDIKYLSSQSFIHFQSRESKFQDLLKALQDKNCNVIGLQGLGGIGKTSMAKEVGHKLNESKLIDKVIFLVVSKPPDFKKIRGELAKGLDLNLDEVKEEELSSTILSKITKMDEKLLIILDDVWEEFDLTEKLGIPFGHQHKGYTLLITARSSHVCTKMECQTIQLQILTNKEALNLFEAHANLNNSSRGFKGMPQKIVRHCGGLPVAIVALARALKNKPISVWKDALKTLEDGGHDPNLEEAYKCLKLSFDNLKSQKAKELLLISSLFPEDSEIPIKTLIKISIGLVSFKENDTYHSIRSDVHGAIMELMHSFLLLNDREKCVKIHDLVREVALWIGENDVQSLLNLEKPIKGNLRYILWKNDKLPDEIDGNKLEYLSILLHDSKAFNVTDTFFKKITSIKVLILANDKRGPALSLANSLQPLKSVQTLILHSLKLGDISALGNLLTLMTLWFYDCLIVELPKEFLKLKKLSSLEVEKCQIKRNNPFEVIEMCSQLEELTFVGNVCDNEAKDAISHNGSPLTLHRYCISHKDHLSYYSEKYGLSRCFGLDKLNNLVSHATFMQLVEGAEVLLLEREDEVVLSSEGEDEVLWSEGEAEVPWWESEDEVRSLEGEDKNPFLEIEVLSLEGEDEALPLQRMWKNLVPDIVPIDKEGMMNDLIVLHLSSYPNMECLIDTKDHDPSMSAFCNLGELHLSNMGVEGLCRGPPPSGFLEQLEILKLTGCSELKSILFNANYNLCHLKSMELEDCPRLMSVFQPSTARSLIQLKKLTIDTCSALEYIIVGEDGDSNQKNYYESLFPSLEELELSGLPSFIGIVRGYHQLMSSSIHKKSPTPFSRHNSRNLNQSLATSAFSWVQACCSLNKCRPASKETNITNFEDRSLDSTNPQKFDTSIDRGNPSLTAQSILLQSLKNVREITFVKCHNLISLSTLSIAASTIALETLTILRCHKLKCITTHEGDAQVDRSYCSIFPTLEKLMIEDCEELEFLFVSAISVGIQKLKSLTIKEVPKLNCVFGNYQNDQHSSNQNQNDELHFDLPSLETLYIDVAPKINNIFVKNYSMVTWAAAEKFDASIDRDAPSLTAQSLLLQSLKNVREIALLECHNVISLSTLSIATSTIALETLTIWRCHKLKCITTHEGDAQVDRSYCSIFPTLEKLMIEDCEELEFLFVSAISVGIQKLKSLTIRKAPKLKCVFGNYQMEQHSSNQNQNNELHFDLPSLETLYIDDAPKINSIFAQNYSMVTWAAAEEVHASTIGAPQFHVTQNLFKNIREIKLEKCTNLISLTILSIASIILLEVLTISVCGQLKCIVGDEGDARTEINYNSIFRKLKRLEVSKCDALEYLFPAYAFRSPVYLESLEIGNNPMMEYVFGRSQHDDSLNPENRNIQTLIDFPALKELCIMCVPKLVSICPKSYYMRGYPRSVILKELPEFTMRHFNKFLVFWHTEQQEKKVIEMCWKTLESLQVCNFRIEEIFDLTYMEIFDELQPLTSSLRQLELVNHSELVNICVGRKCIIHLDCLRFLTIRACKNLRVIFSISIVRSLPVLEKLHISECEQLVRIVEEDCETNVDDHVRHEPCFPNLEQVSVSHCDKLKYLFSITIFDILPKLSSLGIYNAYELEHVLIKRDEMEEIFMNDVIPQPCRFQFLNLPNLISVSRGINSRKRHYFTEVYNCPNFDTSTTQYQAYLKTRNSQVEEKAEERLSSRMGEEITQQSFTKVVEARAECVSSNTLYQSSLTCEKEEPINTSHSLTALPTRDNTHACSKIFEEEEEEQGDQFAPLVTTVSSEKTSQAILSSKASTSLNQAPSYILSQSSNGVDHGDIKEVAMLQNEYKLNVEPSSLIRREQESSYSKGQIQTKDQLTDSQPRSVTILQDEYLEGGIQIVEERGEEGALILESSHPRSLTSKEEPILMSLNSTFISRSLSTTVKTFEEEEKGGLITTPRHENDMKAVSSLPPRKEHKTYIQGDLFVPPMPVISSEQQASDTSLPLSFVPLKALTSPKQISMSASSQSTYSGQLAECGSSEMASPICDIKNASSVAKVKEIVDMMKLEGVEPFMLAEALKAKPQLCLSSEDRSTELLSYSYRVLLNILNILTTRSPLTITEADKRLLAKNLKDASFLGFDKDWLKSIRVKVFNCDASEFHHKQQVLKSLGNKLEANKRELANVRNQEAKAKQSIEMAQKELEAAQSHLNVAQQEYENIRVHHSQLLEECQEILEHRDQCSEIIAVKLKPFGF
ncbi:hypothetical protein QN277_010504 [Acacia crassicarpa]|uniref:NB-ARC domain-containing protein n=1 Tax=Acacia crassicarpa TaxID=499986 RepID=A0AAE1MBR5_9FABA|nr:hypothetical protein QN277_010504 [Acacia crassicarpa]